MPRLRPLLLLLASGLVAGCATHSASLAPAARDPAIAAPASAGAPKVHRVATRVLTPKFGRKIDQLPAIDLQLTNGGTQPLDFSLEQIAAFADDKPIKVYGITEYAQLVQRDIKTAYASAEVNEQSILMRSQWDNMKPGATSPLQARMVGAAQRQDIRLREIKLLGSVAQILHPGAIAPGQTLGGTILLEALPLLSAQRLRLRIQIGSETHEVDFAVQR